MTLGVACTAPLPHPHPTGTVEAQITQKQKMAHGHLKKKYLLWFDDEGAPLVLVEGN